MLLNNFTLRVVFCVLENTRLHLKYPPPRFRYFCPTQFTMRRALCPMLFSRLPHSNFRLPTSDFQSLPHPEFRIQLNSFNLLSTKQPIGFEH